MGNDSRTNNNNNNSNSNNNNGSSNRRGRNGGRKGGRRSNNNSSNKTKAKPVTRELKDIVFDAERFNQADEFIKMKKDLAQYIATNYDRGADVQQSIEAGKMITFAEPTQPQPEVQGGPISETKTLIWKRQIEMYVKRQEKLEDNLRQAFTLVIGQCTEVMINKLEALNEYKRIKADCDVLALLDQMKSLTFKYEEQKYCYSSVYFANKRFYNFKQGQDESCTEYYNKFNNLVSVVESYGGTFGYEDVLMQNDDEYSGLSDNDKADNDNIAKAQERNKEKFLGYCLVAKSDQKRYGTLKVELENDFNKGVNNYPTTVNRALRMLVNYKGERQNNRNNNNNDSNGVNFHQNSRSNSRNSNNNNNNNNNRFDTSWHKDATCHNCNKKGHIKPNCPDLVETVNNNNAEETNDSPNNATDGNNSNGSTNDGNKSSSGGKKKKGTNLLNLDNNKMFFNVIDEYESESDDEFNCNFLMKNQEVQLMSQQQQQEMKKMVLMDSASTCDLWSDRESLNDIRMIKSNMTIESNGGELKTQEKGFCQGYGTVWVHDDAITNIISLKNAKKKFCVTYDSESGNGFLVHTPNGILEFKEHPSGLFYCTLDEFNGVLSPTAVQMIQTVENNKKKYTQRQYQRAQAAYEAYTKIGCPSMHDFKMMIKNGLINNCPITIEDVNVAQDIFGSNVYNLKGKTTRRVPDLVHTDYVEVPREILKLHRDVTLTGDIFFVNAHPFFVTLSRKIKFNTVEAIRQMDSGILIQACERVFNIYTRRGFRIDTMLMDMQFNPIRDALMKCGVRLNPTSASEHVGDIE